MFNTPQSRQISCNKQELLICDNKICTSKYNMVTFIPKNIIEQFSKLPNVYFLLIGFLQMLPSITTSSGVPVIWAPLVFIVIVTALKDLFEDFKRHSQDNQENSKKVLRLTSSGEFQETQWQSLRVGDLVKINRDEYFPADLLILKTSELKNVCFIETKNLDGETNLKNRKAHPEIQNILPKNDNQLYQHNGIFEYELPNPYLYNFTGFYQNDKDQSMKVPLDNQNFVLRGCSLRNTGFIYGLVGYTGHQTKILLNSVKARNKNSQVVNRMNIQVLQVFIVQLIFCLFCSIISASLIEKNKQSLSAYIDIDPVENVWFITFYTKFGNWLLIFTNFVPISLLVTLELVKFLQGIIISKDEQMKTGDIYVNVQSSQLNEELGQIHHIFSDKTGTLTCNLMEFKNVCINGVSYGDVSNMRQDKLNNYTKVTNVDFKDQGFFDNLNNKQHEQYSNINENQLFLSLCHTIITEKVDGNTVYNASSPDELALVNFAKFTGYEFEELDNDNYMIIKVNQVRLKYKLLQVLEFTSSRKRQSVILRDPQNKILLLTKGADSIIEKRLGKSVLVSEVKRATWLSLDKYANTGLRTLVLGKYKYMISI